MEPDSQQHRDLLRLLALKRHEVPPPGFFDRLPNRILVNIRAGSEIGELPWWQRLWDSLVREPMVTSSYAALAMGGLLFGISVFQTAVSPEAHPVDYAGADSHLIETRYISPATASFAFGPGTIIDSSPSATGPLPIGLAGGPESAGRTASTRWYAPRTETTSTAVPMQVRLSLDSRP